MWAWRVERQSTHLESRNEGVQSGLLAVRMLHMQFDVYSTASTGVYGSCLISVCTAAGDCCKFEVRILFWSGVNFWPMAIQRQGVASQLVDCKEADMVSCI